MKRSKVFFRIFLCVCLIMGLRYGTARVLAATNQFRGVNWADPRDNFNTDVIYVSGLSSSDTYDSAAIVAEQIVGQCMSKLGANSIRLPINEATVSQYWNTYTGAIDKALSKGKVILCYWSYRLGVKPADMNQYWAMWSTVVKKYGDNSNCYFELYNEPNAYNATELCNLYYDWTCRYAKVPQSHVILDGAGLAQAVTPVGNDSRLKGCLLAVHDYTMFVNPWNMNEADWEKHISDSVGAYADRTICTEWGAAMGPGSKNGVYFDSQDYSKATGSYFVPYLRGLSNQMRKWNMGSFYWCGVKDGDWYSLVKKSGSGTNITLSVVNQSGLACIQNSWGDVNLPTPDPTPTPKLIELENGWYYIKNVNADKYLQVANDLGNACQNVEVRTFSGTKGQQWYLMNIGNGVFTLKSALGEYMLDVNGEENKDSANIQIYRAHGGIAQQFLLKETTNANAYVIATRCSNVSKVLDGASNNKADGTNVCQWTYHGRENQQWIFKPMVVETPVPTETPIPTETPVPTEPPIPTETPTPTQDPVENPLKVTYEVNNWGSGYQVKFTLTNQSEAEITTWTLQLKKSEIQITSSWNITLTEDEDYYYIKPVDWNAVIQKANSITFGVQGTGALADPLSCSFL